MRLEAVTQKMKYPHPCESPVFGWHHSFPTGLSDPALLKGLECAGFILTIDAPEDVFTQPCRASGEILDTFFYFIFCKYDGVIDLWLSHQEQHGAIRAVRALQFRWYLWFYLNRGKFVFLTRFINAITPLALFHGWIWLHYHRICAPCEPRKQH